MSNTIVLGDCPVCLRTGVEVGPYTDCRKEVRIACVDEHACADAFARLHYEPRKRRA